MIERLVGQCVLRHPGGIVLDVGGVGYGVEMAANSIARVSDGSTQTLWIYTHLSEDSLRLFGFLTMDERQLFALLLSVSRIGPKLALGILAALDARRLVEIVEREDAATLAKVPGIGAQSAKKFILELKPKIEKHRSMGLFASAPTFVGVEGAKAEVGGVYHDLRSALENFGYKEREYAPIVKRLEQQGKKQELSELVRIVLQELTNGSRGGSLAQEEIF
jgi:Holliday junction DNA helicase RuvA